MKNKLNIEIEIKEEKVLNEIIDAFLAIKPILEFSQKTMRIIETEDSTFNSIFYKIVKYYSLEEKIIFVIEDYEALSFFEKLIHTTVSAFREKHSILNFLNSELKIEDQIKKHFVSTVQLQRVKSFDGIELPVYTCGSKNNPHIVLVLPCGMPWPIAKEWMEHLSKDYFVITWETRGLFIDVQEGIVNYNVESQVKDIIAILDSLTNKRLHIFGMCGGAILSLQALSRYPDKFLSASVWHGDYNWKDSKTLTFHQKNIKNIMEMASNSLDEASEIRELICQPRNIETLPAHLSCLMMYPFIDGKLVYLYSKINGEIMNFDIRNGIESIKHKILIVSSEEDTTAHPVGSEMLNEHLSNTVYHKREKGVHASLFDAPKELINVFEKFMIHQK